MTRNLFTSPNNRFLTRAALKRPGTSAATHRAATVRERSLAQQVLHCFTAVGQASSLPVKAIAVAALLLFAAGCRQDMHDQPKYKPLAASLFYPDGRSARPIPPNTIAVDELQDTDPVHTGAQNGDFLDAIPVPVNMALLQRGQDRFDIFCSPCHGRLGDGHGMVAERGFHFPKDFNTDRLREVPPGYLFQVISNGYGGMGDYATQIPDVKDRWAIVAYIRVLQLSRHATLADAPPAERRQLGGQQ